MNFRDDYLHAEPLYWTIFTPETFLCVSIVRRAVFGVTQNNHRWLKNDLERFRLSSDRFRVDLIRYGKTKQNLIRDDWLCAFDVPKRWFWHFYATSLVWNGFLLAFSLNVTLRHHFYPNWLTGLINVLSGSLHTGNQGLHVSTVLLQLLLWSHSLRRLAECLCVSVFSDAVIHLLQYVFGLAYYLLLGLTVLCSDHQTKASGSLLSQLKWFHLVGIALFVAASVLQHQSLVLLAGLRTGKSGSVETLAHRMPKGGCFELVSCPHYLAELLIYVSLSLVAGGLSLTWWLVVLYVLFNQALAALLCHDHYVGKYPSYPARRKAFIPFVM
ncbi:polyprenol reductase [Phyllopteryx taeniolatus]|uniref:polyprenol reductase n=1 Tax=Phyllopteryx taeniolatus TaxID=161469 RepID=UPI002AD483E8|nr:polyprenol reductase [Phyllopteryx taeniolatus]